jgi:hypothetical protein
MTKEQLDQKLDVLAKKRDHAADTLNKPLLAWTYQDEINKLVDAFELANNTSEKQS